MCTIMGSQRERVRDRGKVLKYLCTCHKAGRTSAAVHFRFGAAPHVMMVNQQINRLQMGCTQEVA